MRFKLYRNAFMALPFLLLAALQCKRPPAPNFENVNWRLDSVQLNGRRDPVPGTVNIRIRMSSGAITSSGTCNKPGFSYLLRPADSIYIHGGAVTDMLCEEPHNTWETILEKTMNQVVTWKMPDKHHLQLYGKDESVLYWER